MLGLLDISSFGFDFVINFFNNQNPLLNTHVYNNEIINITDELLVNAIQNGYKLPEGTTVRNISYDICVIVKGIIFDWCVRHGEFDIKQYSKELLGKSLKELYTHLKILIYKIFIKYTIIQCIYTM